MSPRSFSIECKFSLNQTNDHLKDLYYCKQEVVKISLTSIKHKNIQRRVCHCFSILFYTVYEKAQYACTNNSSINDWSLEMLSTLWECSTKEARTANPGSTWISLSTTILSTVPIISSFPSLWQHSWCQFPLNETPVGRHCHWDTVSIPDLLFCLMPILVNVRFAHDGFPKIFKNVEKFQYIKCTSLW